MDDIMKLTEEKMQKSIKAEESEFAGIRAGRANAAVLDKITVDYYGVPTAINQMAGISTPEARMLAIQPYDISMLKEIEKAIQASDLGINPSNDGKIIRLVFPPLNEERRKELIKKARSAGENCKVVVRNARRDAVELLKKAVKNEGLPEDGQKEGEEEVQKVTDKNVKEIDALIAAKEKDIMTV